MMQILMIKVNNSSITKALIIKYMIIIQYWLYVLYILNYSRAFVNLIDLFWQVKPVR